MSLWLFLSLSLPLFFSLSNIYYYIFYTIYTYFSLYLSKYLLNIESKYLSIHLAILEEFYPESLEESYENKFYLYSSLPYLQMLRLTHSFTHTHMHTHTHFFSLI